MTRTLWVLGNWKQNHLPEAAAACARQIADDLPDALRGTSATVGDIRVGIAPPYLSLAATRPFVRPHAMLWLLAQDCGAQDAGAFTGEVGPNMIAAAGAEAAIIGHSERRALFGDTDRLVQAKLRAALAGGLTAVLCVGEALEVRQAGAHEAHVVAQLDAALAGLGPEAANARLVVAYEPVWAIGTGHTATPEQAAAMHRRIRAWLTERFGSAGTDRSILYGGSVKADNAQALVAAGDIDGFLVGGASLEPASFLAIVARAAAHVGT